MATEIERKFLVADDSWKRSVVKRVAIRDGLVALDGGRKTRVRVMDQRATIAVKGRYEGIARAEYEYEIPLADAEEMLLTLCDGRVLEKHRYFVPYGGLTWEVDVYDGLMAGVVIAEVELDRADRILDLPGWVGREVTGDVGFSKHQMFEARRRQAAE